MILAAQIGCPDPLLTNLFAFFGALTLFVVVVVVGVAAADAYLLRRGR